MYHNRVAKADLHIHTTASDGRMSPVEVVREAANLNLAVIAITDHDTTRGIQPALEEAKNYDLEVMPGVEITTAFDQKECHLLAYDFDIENESIRSLLKAHQKARVSRAQWIIRQLKKEGLQLDIDEVLAEAGGRNVGRPHIAEILRKKGYIGSVKEAFIRYLSDDALGIIESNYYAFDKVINMVKKAGGVVVLAHPGRLYGPDELKQLVQAGFDGIETKHPSHNYEIQKQIEEFAARHNLLMTGGSDFHGEARDYYRHFGTLTVEQSCVDQIQALAERRKKLSP